MKKSILTFALLIGFIFGTTAQKKHKQQQKPEFTVEQQTTLTVKKLTIALDLTESQQEKMYPLMLVVTDNKQKAMEERKANGDQRPNLSNDELYAKMIEKMDQQIALQARVKKVLSKDQYESWKKIQAQMHKQHASQKGKHKAGHKGKPAQS